MSVSTKPHVLVTLATGTIGTAVTMHLLENSFRVRCLTRSPASAASRALRSAGATLVWGDLSVPSTLKDACEGIDAVFMNLPPGPDSSVQARHLLEAARASGTVHAIVYTGLVWGYGDDTKTISETGGNSDSDGKDEIDHGKEWVMQYLRTNNSVNDGLTRYFKAKEEIERVLRNEQGDWLRGRWTILRMPWFMTNFLPPNSNFYYPGLDAKPRKLRSAIPPDGKMMLLDPQDLAQVAGKVLLDLDNWAGRIVNMGSEPLGMNEIGSVLSEVLGEEVQVEMLDARQAEEEVRRGASTFRSQTWYQARQNCFDPAELARELQIELTPFKKFLEKNHPHAVRH